VHWEIRGLEKLSFRERQVIMLKESGRASEDIANMLQLSVSSVSTLLSRAKIKGYQIVGIIPDSDFGIHNTLAEDTYEDE